MKNPYSRLIINIALLITGFIVVYSGFLIQFSYHMGQHGVIDFNKTVLHFNYSGWSNIHKIAILSLTVFMAFHFVQHWNWFKTIIKKNLIQKNKQVFILSTVFILAAITGYISWLIDLTGNDQRARTVFLEIHDKLTIILFIFLILHIAKRLKWFRVTIKRIINNEFTQQ
jgi:cytochrome b